MSRALSLVFVAVVALTVGACGGEPVGRICDLGVEVPSEMQAIVASPSLDCTTRTCLKFPNQNPNSPSVPPAGNKGLCTAECESDSDCERVPNSVCVNGFTCGVVVTVGPFCCRNFCICKDYVVLPNEDEGLPVPQACNPEIAANECQNLPGRGE